MPSVAPQWQSTEEHAALGGNWQSTDEHTDQQNPIMAQIEGVGRSLKNQAKFGFDTLSSLVDPHLGQKIGDATIDAQVDQWHKAKEEYAQGNYGNALRRGLAAVTPFIGPLIENTAEKMTSGRPGAIAEGVTDVTALPLLLHAAGSAPEVGKAISDSVGTAVSAAKKPFSKVVEIASKPGNKEKLVGTGQILSGAGGVVSGYPPAMAAGGAAMLRGAENISKGRSIATEAANAAPPLFDKIAEGFGAKSFAELDPDGQATVRNIVQRVEQGRGTLKSLTTVPPADLGPIDIGPPSPKGKTPGDLVDEYIAARKAATQVPAQPSQRVPVWQREGLQPAAIPENPANPTVAPQSRQRPALVPVLDHQTGETVAYVKPPATVTPIAPGTAEQLAESLTGSRAGGAIEASSGIHPPPEAFEGTYRAKRAQVIADRLHEHGVTYEEASHLTPEHLTETQWEAVLGKDPQTGVQYRTPSLKTIEQARVRLAHKYAAGRSIAGMAAARELAEETLKVAGGR